MINAGNNGHCPANDQQSGSRDVSQCDISTCKAQPEGEEGYLPNFHVGLLSNSKTVIFGL